MSRDSNYTYIHSHSSHHADLFEDFCHPPSSTNGPGSTNPTSTTNQPNNQSNNQPSNPQPSNTDPEMIHVPGHFLPFEEIQLPPHLMPVNPEDEDDVVPDMHAAFGIQRALGAGGELGDGGAAREPVWRDLGLERLLEGVGAEGSGSGSASANGRRGGFGGGLGTASMGRREGRRNPLLLMR